MRSVRIAPDPWGLLRAAAGNATPQLFSRGKRRPGRNDRALLRVSCRRQPALEQRSWYRSPSEGASPQSLSRFHHRQDRVSDPIWERLRSRTRFRLQPISLAVEPHIAAVLVDLEPEAIPLGLVQPIVAFGWTNGCRGGEGTDERETMAWDCGTAALSFHQPSRATRKLKKPYLLGFLAGRQPEIRCLNISSVRCVCCVAKRRS
jgi:hypothetical protein